MHPSRDETAPSSSRSAPGSVLDDSAEPPQSPFWVLLLGAVGVVYGDIGTSPLYALRESLRAAGGTTTRADVLGICSLLLWALIVVVTAKYVLFLLRADNNGEGGTLSLLALARSAVRRRARIVVFALGIAGAAFFYGDSAITPAISVLSAVEGLGIITPALDPYVMAIATVILIALFAIQSRGTASVSALFGPVILVWFVTLAVGGAVHIARDPEILWAFLPTYAAGFLFHHGFVGFIVLGAVFLVVTGAEALYADMGHFGRAPIQAAWLGLVFPALTINYLGQGALVLADPTAAANPFFRLYPDWALIPIVVLATAATVIASQAVITGAYSLTRQAIQLGLLPRMEIRHTSAMEPGQIYMPRVNTLMLLAVLLVVILFRSSSNLASAYGIAVTGTMIVTTALAAIVARRVWNWSPFRVAAVLMPFALVELTFLAANLTKFLDGGYVPLTMTAMLAALMWTWLRGTRIVARKLRRESVALFDLAEMLRQSRPHRVPGTAVFLTANPDLAPPALLHNLKHNGVLHADNIILTIRTEAAPRVAPGRRIRIRQIRNMFVRVEARFGYMETPSVPLVLALLRRRGMPCELQTTSFFLGRRTMTEAARPGGMPPWQDRLYMSLAHSATNATDFFRIPPDRVVELGQRIAI